MLKNSLLVLASIVVGVLIIEAALRLVYTPRPLEIRMEMVAAGVGEGDSTLKWDSSRRAYQPLHTATIVEPEYRHTVLIDRYGFRNPCLKEPIDGFLVGDSSVFGIGVDDEHTFECSYARRGKNTYSLGVSGAAPRHYIRLIEEHGERLKKEFSFKDGFFVQYFLSLGNDFPLLASFKEATSREAEGKTKPERRGNSLSKTVNKMIYHDSSLRHSYVLQMLKLVAVSSAPQCKECSYLDLRGGDRLYRTTIDAREAERHVDAIVKFLDSATKAAKRAGAASVEFVLLRGAHIINKERLDRVLSLQGASAEEFNLNYQSEIMARAAMRRPDLPVIDTTACLKESPRIADLHYKHDGHFTPFGVETFIDCLSGSSRNGNNR